MCTFSILLAWMKRASPPRDIVLTVVGALAGGAISHVYYVRALGDMKVDAAERGRVDELIFRGIEAIGDLKYARDTTGRVIGVAIELRSVASAQALGTGALRVTPASGAVR